MTFAQLTEMSRHETQYVHVPVEARDSSGTLVDPTGDTVELTFHTSTTLPDQDELEWYDATWVTADDGTYYARVLVGPDGGDVQLAAGMWWAFARITDNPETPIVTGEEPFFVR
jgi:hypothetical protein